MESRKMVSLPAELAEQVEDYRFANRLKTEADAIRRLIQLGLDYELRMQRDMAIEPKRTHKAEAKAS
jgi:hypothetical protein